LTGLEEQNRTVYEAPQDTIPMTPQPSQSKHDEYQENIYLLENVFEKVMGQDADNKE
jgi:hypothetical protein